MSLTSNIESIQIADAVKNARNSMFNKVSWNKRGEVSRDFPQQKEFDIPVNKTEQLFDNLKNLRFNISALNIVGSFSNTTLEQLRINHGGSAFKDHGKWIADVTEENNRITFTNVRVSEHNGAHEHPVFQSISFRNMIITFDIGGEEKKLYLDSDSPNFDPNNQSTFSSRQVGFNGKLDSDARDYQMGISQYLGYSFKCGDTVIILSIQLSCVFMYPLNDFEPTGIIDANKIFPQILFVTKKFNTENYPYGDLDAAIDIPIPSGKNGNTIKIKKFNARIKLICNNNSTHHIKVENGRDKDYFPELRATNNIPPMFERWFYSDLLTSNIVGLYTDSNFGTSHINGSSDKLRDKPNYKFEIIPGGNEYRLLGVIINRSQPAPFWSNIFDNAIYNLKEEYEFIAVHGIQGDRFDEESFKFSETEEAYDYPPGQTEKKITIKKHQRQASFDNMHLHGYLGHYQDNNQPVIHAPICGYCCFHMHWRWSDLNANLSGNPILRGANNGPKAALTASGKKYKGWHTNINNIVMQEPFKQAGMPLIPYEQQLKIAITHPNAEPADEDAHVTPSNLISLDSNLKAVWYCVDIINNDNEFYNSHLVMEQGCGYAFDYSKDGKNTRYAPLYNSFIPRLLRKICEENLDINDQVFLDYVYRFLAIPKTKLEPRELFELQYRLMRLFNEATPNIPPGRQFLNQIPGINDNPTTGGVIDNNTRENLESIFDLIVNQ